MAIKLERLTFKRVKGVASQYGLDWLEPVIWGVMEAQRLSDEKQALKQMIEWIEKNSINVLYQPDRHDRLIVTENTNYEAVNMLCKNKLKLDKKTRGRLLFVDKEGLQSLKDQLEELEK